MARHLTAIQTSKIQFFLISFSAMVVVVIVVARALSLPLPRSFQLLMVERGERELKKILSIKGLINLAITKRSGISLGKLK